MTRTRFLIEVDTVDAARVRAMLAGGVRGFHGLAARDGHTDHIVELAAAVLTQLGADGDGRPTPAQAAGDVLRVALGYGWWTRGLPADGGVPRVMLHGPHGAKLIVSVDGVDVRVRDGLPPGLHVVRTDLDALTAAADEVVAQVRRIVLRGRDGVTPPARPDQPAAVYTPPEGVSP